MRFRAFFAAILLSPVFLIGGFTPLVFSGETYPLLFFVTPVLLGVVVLFWKLRSKPAQVRICGQRPAVWLVLIPAAYLAGMGMMLVLTFHK